MRVLLNSLAFESGDRAIVPFGVEALSATIRETGLQRRSDFQVYNRVAYNDWSKGIGFARARRESGLGVGGLRDADAETRFDDGIRLALLNQDSTDVTDVDVSRFAVEFNGLVLLLGEQAGGGVDVFMSRTYSGANTSWASVGTATNVYSGTDSSVPQDAVPHKNRLWIALTLSTGNPWVRIATDATTFANPTNNLPSRATGAGANNDDDPGVKLVDFNNVLYAFIRDSTNREIEIHKTADEGGTAWTSVTQFSSGYGPMSATVWYDLQGDPAPVIGTAEGVWALDDSASVAQLIFPMAYNTENCRLLIARGQYLYVSAGTGEIYELRLTDIKNITFRDIGPNRHGGLPTVKTGAVSGRAALSPRWLFVPYGGLAASRQASILAYDFEKDAWHSVYYHGTANQRIPWLFLSDRDDGTVRLHFGVRTSTTATDERFIANPLLEQASSGALAREADGYVEFPEDDFGDPHETGVLYRALVDATDLSASTAGEYLEFLFGRTLTGAAAGAYADNDVGDFLSGTLTLDPSVNTTFRSLLPRVELNRDGGTNTDTPVLRELELRVEKKLDTILGFVVPIDLVKSGGMNERRGPEDALADLLTVVRSVTTVPFQWGGEAPINVKVKLLPQGGVSTSEPSEFDLGAIKEGVVYVQVVEPLR